MPQPLAFHAAVALADGLTGLVCGGLNALYNPQAACYYYNSQTDTWTSAPALNVARGYPGMVLSLALCGQNKSICLYF